MRQQKWPEDFPWFSSRMKRQRNGIFRQLVKEVKGRESVGIFIGPEGGFEPAEIEELRESGGQILSLGKRILRTETAGMAMLSVLMFELEE